MARKPLVLIVDDVQDLVTVLEAVLADHGYQCRTATSGKEALQAVNQGPSPDLVILDASMPDVDGMTVLRILKNEPQTAAVPVVMYSANDDERQVRDALKMGACDYWVKGNLSADELQERVDHVIETQYHGDPAPPGK